MNDQNVNMESMEEPFERYNQHKDFVSLEAWKKCRLLKIFFYSDVIPVLPREEKNALGFQIRKAAVSATANIAEGYGRYSFKEGIQFYRISRGSVYELKDHLITCLDLHFINDTIYKNGIDLIEEAKATLNGYIKYVKNKLNE